MSMKEFNNMSEEAKRDFLYDKAVQIVREKSPRISCIQRHLGIGYNRAAFIMDDMEKSGVVSEIGFDGTRKVIKQTTNNKLKVKVKK